MTKTSSSVPPSEPTASPIKGKRIRQFLKEMWAILRARITMGREWVVRVLKKIRDFFAKLIPKPKSASEKSKLDNYLEKSAYYIVFGFVALGVVVLIGSLFSDDMKFTRNVYYFFIFIGAGLAATLATWRGRQSERQISKFEQQIEDSRSERRVARFEKAIDMATDPINLARREGGFLIFRQMFFTSGENFDDLIEENLNTFVHLSINNFRMTAEQREDFGVLYTRSRNFYGKEINKDAKVLYTETHNPFLNELALGLWREMVNWRIGGKLRTSDVDAIDSARVRLQESAFFIFSGMNLNGKKFLVEGDNKKANFSSQHARANFRGSCFMQVEMHNVNIRYVDFSRSQLTHINDQLKGHIDYKISCIGTVFNEANLLECNFAGADLNDASFVGTNISGSDFSQARNLFEKQFKRGAYWVRPDDPQLLKQARPHFPNNFPPDFANKLPDKPPTAEIVWKWEMEAGLYT